MLNVLLLRLTQYTQKCLRSNFNFSNLYRMQLIRRIHQIVPSSFFFIILCLRSKITMSFLRNEKYFQFTEMKNRQTDKNKEGHVTACCFYLIFRRDMLSTIVLQQLHHVVQKAPCPKSHRETCHQINSIQFNDVNCKNVIFVM